MGEKVTYRLDQGPVPTKWAITERGKQIRHTVEEVEAALRLLVANGGEQKITAEQLKDEGFVIEKRNLANWRDKQFPRLYMKLRTEMGREVAERIAGSAMERAMEADQATQIYIQEAVAKVKEVDANHLARNAKALADTMGETIEKSQLLRGQPTQHVAVDVQASIEVLERLGVVKKDETIDAQVIEEEDA